jgi:hypothetical protein
LRTRRPLAPRDDPLARRAEDPDDERDRERAAGRSGSSSRWQIGQFWMNRL